ncbi:MAG: molybdenum cofactor biosynthesis protein MoaE [Saprospirales bacterium]|nr:molybdenum cofactor biosynthesis protein MoaE [Saprospirales bacterium]
MIDIALKETPLDIQTCIDYVSSPEIGGINIFVCTVRNHTRGKRVLHLDFEAYEPMALSELRKIAETARFRFQIDRICIHHRTGRLEIGEVPVVIAVGAAHRQAAFEACQYAIDALKETVPIWKKEYFEDGEVWVAAHP